VAGVWDIVAFVVEGECADTGVVAAVDDDGRGGGIAAVASGRIPIVDDASIGMEGVGFRTNERNKCRHRSSGISELSTSFSRNCRKLR